MKKILFMSFFAMLVLAACVGASPASIEGGWKLVSYGPALEQVPAAADVATSIEFKDGQMSGNVGCNGFGGEYSTKDGQIEFGPIMSTMMFCEGPVGEQETGTLAVLQETTTFVFDDNTLTITSADGAMSIVLER